MKNKTKKWPYLIILAVVLLDQLAKFFVVANIKDFESVTIIPHVLSFTNILNSGIIFGIFFQNNNAIVIISLLLVCALLVWLLLVNMGKIKFASLTIGIEIAFCFILGGAISNIIDRMFRIAVIDYVQLNFLNFPIFNLADIAITAGAILLIWEIIFPKKAKQ